MLENSRQAGAGHWTVEGECDGEVVRLTVCDNGVGVPPGDRDRLFEPFFTGRRAEGGSGLGVPIARPMLEACGGTLELVHGASGAAFAPTLPAAPRARPRP